MRASLLLGGWNGFLSVENFGEQLAEVRRLGLIKLSAAIFRRISPRIRRAHESAGQLVIAEVEKFRDDGLNDDGGDLARLFCAFHLELEFDEAAEVVGDFFEDAS